MPDGICGVKTRNALDNINGDTWSEIQHFKPEEFTCKCGCGYNPINLHFVTILEQIRAHFGGKPLIITSGCRCSTHNKKVGGVQGSKHVLGNAVDFYIPRSAYRYFTSLLSIISKSRYFRLYLHK